MAAPASVTFDIEYEGETLTGVVDEETIAIFEDATDRSITEVGGVGGRPPKLSLLGAFLASALTRNHADRKFTRIDGMKMLKAPGVLETLLGSAADSMPQDGDVPDDMKEGGGSTENPPRKRRPSKGGKKG
ncbi:MAG: hypothetical protein CL955_06825 [Erythrobacteraceae bacterium]|nr:hypothetical protein [Erythrobacteraceae bacterium]